MDLFIKIQIISIKWDLFKARRVCLYPGSRVLFIFVCSETKLRSKRFWMSNKELVVQAA